MLPEAKNMKKLILMFTHYTGRLRPSVKAHIDAFAKYSANRIIEINTAFSVDWDVLKAINPEGIILHTSFLSLRWGDLWPSQFNELCNHFEHKAIECVALPQDEFLYSSVIEKLCIKLKVRKLYTCAKTKDLKTLYPKLSKLKVEFIPTLTAFVSKKLLRTKADNIANRGVFVSYRVWSPAAWLGNKATIKTAIGIKTIEICESLGLKYDISFDQNHTLVGRKWFNLLQNSRCVIGMEGGSSIADTDGKVREAVESGSPVPLGRDGEIDLFCLSPRHFEAASLKIVQILIEGDYNGILEANVHYIPVKPDLSNLKDAIIKAQDDAFCQKLVDDAYRDIIASKQYTYNRFVSEFDNNNFEALPHIRPKHRNNYLVHVLWLRSKIVRLMVPYFSQISRIAELKNNIKHRLK